MLRKPSKGLAIWAFGLCAPLSTHKEEILNKLCTSGESHPGIIIFKILSSFLNNVQRRTNKWLIFYLTLKQRSHICSVKEKAD